MLNIDVRGIMGKNTSRYSLVTAIAKRAREIVDDADSGKVGVEGKPVTLALNDFLEGRYALLESDELHPDT